MNIKILIYVFTTLLSVYTLSGINFNKIWKTNKTLEAKLFVILLSFALSYLITNLS